jgi:Tol biopolymer transport system component/predicted Ser/Thr protein kinase
LGKGGMGAVYLAQDLTLQIQVAVKENLNPSPEAERQFKREASLLATLRHPNLPRVTDHFILEGKQYLVMDYIEGEDLASVAKKGTPSADQVLNWSMWICDALIYLHSRQPPVIHRDIKPANIKLSPDGKLMLVDFGIAKIYDSTETATGARGLTPGFSPPEQYGGSPTDHRSDQYSLGATLYNLLTGELPLDSIVRMMKRTPVESMRKIKSEIPTHVDLAIRKAMELDPEDRFPDLVHFKAALRGRDQPQTVRSEEPVLLPISELPKARKPWTRYAPIGVGILAVAFIGLMIAGGFSGFSFGDKPDPTSIVSANEPTKIPTKLPTSTSVPSSTPTDIPTATHTPTPTSTVTPIPTATPIPIGGGGIIAFVSDRADDGLLQVFTMRPDGSDVTQVTFGPGNKSQPSWSPDGKRIAFVSDKDGNQEIYVMNVDSSHMVNLTNHPEDEYDPAWSPDGSKLAFTTTRYGDQLQVYVIDVDCPDLDQDCSASEARSFSRGYADERFPAWAPEGAAKPNWLPEGETIAVAISINNAANRLFFRALDGERVPVQFDLQDRIMSVHDVRWSPDGNFIIFTWRLPGKFEIYALPIADRGNNWTKLTNSLGNVEPAISPDGQWIVFTSTRDQNPEIYIMSINGSNQTNLTNRLGRDRYPDWQPPVSD